MAWATALIISSQRCLPASRFTCSSRTGAVWLRRQRRPPSESEGPMPHTHRLGALDLAIVSDGDYYVDAGAVFGLVPRVLWEGIAGPLDDHHRLAIGLNCLLVRSSGRLVLIET